MKYVILIPFSSRKYQIEENYIRRDIKKTLKIYKEKNINIKMLPNSEKIIWFCWWQGIEKATPIVKYCYSQLKKNAGDYRVVVIDSTNYSEFIKLPKHVVEKFKEDKFDVTHISDLIRFNLLYLYGGIWIDATCLLCKKMDEITPLIDVSFFSQKFVVKKEKSPIKFNPSYGRWATYFMATNKRHHPLFGFVKDSLNEYWEGSNNLIEYFLIDFLLDIAYDDFLWAKYEIDSVPINNETVFFFSSNNKYNSKNDNDAFIYKLSNKEFFNVENIKCQLCKRDK